MLDRQPLPAILGKCQGRFDRSVSLLSWGYNEEALVPDFLDRAINLLSDTVEDWEIIFVDDGSTDRTGAIADEYARREPRLRVLHNPAYDRAGGKFFLTPRMQVFLV